MNRVLIIGSPGAGKSTFAAKLSIITGLPLHHLDLIWHLPDRTTLSREEFDSRLDGILKSERWIIDGNYRRTMQKRLDCCDTVFWLDLPVSDCLRGIRDRVGKPRADMPWTETAVDPEFESFVRTFPDNERPYISALLDAFENCGGEVVHFRSRAEADAYLSAAAWEIRPSSIKN